jgi:hypothetical protein
LYGDAAAISASPGSLVHKPMTKPLPPKVKKFPAAKQRALDHLLEKNSEGSITPNERIRLEQLVSEAESLMVANAKRLF